MVIRRCTVSAVALAVGSITAGSARAQNQKNVTIPDPPKSGKSLLVWFMITKVGRGSSGHQDNFIITVAAP